MEETPRKRQERDRHGETRRPAEEGRRREQPQPEKAKRDQDRQKKV